MLHIIRYNFVLASFFVQSNKFKGASVSTLISLALLVLGAVICFFGFKVHRIFIASWGVVIGAVIGSVIIGSISHNDSTFAIMGAIVGGIVGGAALIYLYKFGIFLMGALVGSLVATAII